MNLFKQNKCKIFALIFLILIIIVVIVVIFIKLDNFTNSSGYGFNTRFGKRNTLIPLNLINKSTDFNLFSLNSQLKFNFLKPSSEYINTNTDVGIVSRLKKSKNIILFPGLQMLY